MTGDFREFLYPLEHPRLAAIRGMDAYAYGEAARRGGTFTGDLIKNWSPLYLNPFRGITEDGSVRDDLHLLEPARRTEAAPVAAMAGAACALLGALDVEARRQITYPVDAVEWQTWSNPEFLQFDTGIRLESHPFNVRDAAMGLVKASLSPRGYYLARSMMLINGFLGEAVELPAILNEFSYNIALFGVPDLRKPWGWQLFGHHLAINCMVVDGNMVLSPLFLGAEPNEVDQGAHTGVGHDAFTARVELGVQLMAELTAEQRRAATLFSEMVDPAMPAGRIHPGDERHLAGAFQDNRQIPFEGLPVAEMSPAAKNLALRIMEDFVSALPAGPRAARMRELRKHLDNTWLCWIGGHEPGEVFYYRIQSPVIVAELDHHCGVFLANETPQPFHIHTVLRTPHGNDYGRAYLRQWQDSK